MSVTVSLRLLAFVVVLFSSDNHLLIIQLWLSMFYVLIFLINSISGSSSRFQEILVSGILLFYHQIVI